MTRRDDHFQSAHSEKEEWVTPKISPLEVRVTHGKTFPLLFETTGHSSFSQLTVFGPS